MRILAATTALLLLAFMAPTATARGPYLCIPPGTLNQACAGDYGNGDLCAWPNGASPLSPVCVNGVLQDTAPVCLPPASDNHMCIGIRDDGAACAWIYGGPAYSYVCVTRAGKVDSCSNNLYAPIYGAGWHCFGEPLP